MPQGTIKIKDRDVHGLPAVELGDILPLLESEGRQLNWAIQDLYAVGQLARLGRTMRDFGDEVCNSSHGVVLNWDELEEFSRSVFQILNARIVGFRRGAEPPARLPRGEEKDCELVIEAIDPSLWRLSAQSEDVVDRCKSFFNDWEVSGTEH